MAMRILMAAALMPLAFSTVMAGELVTPRDLAEGFFDGRTIRSTDGRGRTAELAFARSGEVVLRPQSGEPRAGSWRLSDEGFCMNLGGRDRWSCYVVLRNADGGLRALATEDGFAWTRVDQAAAAEPVSGLAGSQP